jgi:hypothetical protein
MGTLRTKASELVERFIEEAITTGLTWDEAVAVFGLAAKASAQAAAAAGEGTETECLAHARQRFEEVFAQQVHVVVADASVSSLDAAAGDNALLTTANRRPVHKHH